MMRGPRLRALLPLLLLAGCATRDALEPGPASALPARPPPRAAGERMPAFSGGDPATRGWVKVDDLLWLDARHAEAYGRGLVFDGSSWVPLDRALPPGTPAEEGFLLRTDHVSLRTDLAWASGLGLVRKAEDHVRALMARYGERLDLRLPEAPLTVVALARREDFVRRLRGAVDREVTWGAFYDARSGAVFVCQEPAPHGALPLETDLRHEMTHQVLDLSTPPVDRSEVFAGRGFWLWEGIAVHAEGFGDPPGAENRVRLDRFRRRLAWGEWTPLDRLFALSQREFEGTHYDQTASVVRFLLEESGPRTREALLDDLRNLLHRAAPPDLERRIGLSAREIEGRWLSSLAR